MSAELVAILCLFAFSVSSAIFAAFQMRKVKGEIYDFGNSILEGFGEMFTTPTVKKAFTILGKQGGEAKAESALVNQICQKAKELHIRRVEIGIIAENVELCDWYKKRGFIMNKRVQFDQLPFAVLFMYKILKEEN